MFSTVKPGDIVYKSRLLNDFKFQKILSGTTVVKLTTRYSFIRHKYNVKQVFVKNLTFLTRRY